MIFTSDSSDSVRPIRFVLPDCLLTSYFAFISGRNRSQRGLKIEILESVTSVQMGCE